MKKKVILLNTHLSDFANMPDIVCSYLKYLFDIVRNDGRILLIWRPHPLTLISLEMKDQNLYTEYLKVIDDFKQIQNGIYDESSDYQMAFSISDAYIGSTGSSLTEMYRLLGKPMFTYTGISDIWKTQNAVPFIAGAAINEWIYFSARYFNGFFKLNVNTNEIVYLGYFDKENEVSLYIHRKAFYDGKNIWFVPQRGNYITKIDIETMKMKSLDIPKGCIVFNKHLKISDIVEDREYLWLIPAGMESLLILNTKTDEIESISLGKYLDRYKTQELLFLGGDLVEKNIWLCPYDSSNPIIVNVDSKEVKILDWKMDKRSYSNIQYDGKYVWFSPQKAKMILRIEPTTQIREEFVWAEESELCSDNFINVIFYQGHIWMLPYMQKCFLKIEDNTFSRKNIPFSDDSLYYPKYPKENIFIYPIIVNNVCAVTSDFTKKILAIDPQERDELRIIADLNLKREMYEDCIGKSINCLKNQEERKKAIDIPGFIETISLNEYSDYGITAPLQVEAGAQIWKQVKEVL